ncbi:bacterio-opsin activator domain-containing protein [Haloarcula sp. GH36]|uniref:bacterio-opsin activator domain-containing protein n=1 Tax=Haloarcula montana TaxID=3111776 RepID=UPI002D789689|nr:bacterio-opsin activator domain-containing protein [Haloarcula sp. GH36]
MTESPDVLGRRGYRRLRRAADTHRADLVVRLGAEVGLRPAEMCRLRTGDIEPDGDAYFLAVRADDGIARETYLPADVEHDVRKYARSNGRDTEEPLFDVSPRRLQMLVGEVATRAAEDHPELADVSSRDLRWRFAAALLSDGVPPHVVCALGGWERLDRLQPLVSEPDRAAILSAVDGTGEEETSPTLRRLAAVLADIGETLVGAGTGTEIEQTVCDRVAETEGFEFAWVAERTGDGFTRQAMAGTEPETVTAQLQRHETPLTAAVDDGTVRVVEDGGFVAAPIVRGDTVAGVLAVGTDADDDATRELLAALGAQIGHGLAAVQRKRLLLADTVTELTFECTDSHAVTVGLSTALGCTVELSGLVPVGGGSLLYYLTVEGASAGPVLSHLTDAADVSDARLIEDYGEGALLEVVVTEAPALALIERGGRVQELTVADGTATLVTELPGDTDVRPVVDAVVAAYPETTLAAKRETDRPVESETGFRDRLSDRLTDRQESVLRAAFHSGYFEWPRGSTAEELADSLDVSSPTLHNHLRRAQQKVLTAFFTDGPVEDSP